MAPKPPLTGAASAKYMDKGLGSSRQNSVRKDGKDPKAQTATKKKKPKASSDLSPLTEEAPAG
eukprot:CAMPEP_0202775356 /NCGR_PEP_ID=MMETSP1388-20130828/48276_1 /ASSEMBLY_ACC=CAM_ASM_000864 /TAXON_ID=37098 /ORGANISM="Isochrysis sp, Strain CCMP1244" /LENGTH=62 /DNA_ID=CAMNT_0049444463 /DNA_START=23 /DNA_END=208 /DNA_ORIENTATION=+